MNTLIFGMGNPSRGEDSIGIRVAGELKKNFDLKKNFIDIQSGNIEILSLLELSRDYDRLVIIDADTAAIRIKEYNDYTDSLSTDLERKLHGIVETISNKLKLTSKISSSD